VPRNPIGRATGYGKARHGDSSQDDEHGLIGDADERTPPAERRRGRWLVVQAVITAIAVVLLAVERGMREGTPWLVVLAIALPCLALAASVARYSSLRDRRW
jgi:hypothetical protein